MAEEEDVDSFQFTIKTGGGQVDLKWSAYANHFRLKMDL
jgi:hypothetical protein